MTLEPLPGPLPNLRTNIGGALSKPVEPKFFGIFPTEQELKLHDFPSASEISCANEISF